MTIFLYILFFCELAELKMKLTPILVGHRPETHSYAKFFYCFTVHKTPKKHSQTM